MVTSGSNANANAYGTYLAAAVYKHSHTRTHLPGNCSQNSHMYYLCAHHDFPPRARPIARRFLTLRLLAMQDGQGAAEAAAQPGAWQA